MELIDREAVREFIKSYSHSTDVVYHMEKHLYEVPTIDAVPVVHGEWLPMYDGNEYGDVFQCGCYCSECGEELQSEPNYCPNCGAKMEVQDG